MRKKVSTEKEGNRIQSNEDSEEIAGFLDRIYDKAANFLRQEET